MAYALPAQLAGDQLTDREAIADACYRAVLSIDHADEALLLSAVTDDIYAEVAGTKAHGIAELKAIFSRVAALDTTHFLSNMRISVVSPTAATVTFSSLAQHVTPGKGFQPGPNKFMSGGMAVCDVVKVGDLWKMKTWKAKTVWVDGDMSVMANTQPGSS